MSSGKNSTEGELLLCARLARSLTHLIRGDLSVINNDLAYLSTIVGAGELERSRSRCSQVASTLGKLSLLSSVSMKEVTTLSVAAVVLGVSESEATQGRSTVLDRVLMSRAIAVLKELVGPWKPCVTRVDDESGSTESVSFDFEMTEISQLRDSYASVSAYASGERGERYVIDGCVVDFILRDHGWRVEICSGRESAMIRFWVPLVV